MPRTFGAVDTVADVSQGDASSASAARLVALAMTMLLVSFLVLSRSYAALDSGGASSTRLQSGAVELTDDDGGLALFDLRALAPGQAAENCITVTYRGTIFDLEVGMRVRGGGALAPHLLTKVEMGSGGGYGSCDGFRAGRTIYDGTLAELQALHGPSTRALPTFVARQTPDSRTFRITFEMTDTVDAQGLEASADILWSAGA